MSAKRFLQWPEKIERCVLALRGKSRDNLLTGELAVKREMPRAVDIPHFVKLTLRGIVLGEESTV
jgi:hypothetical protein